MSVVLSLTSAAIIAGVTITNAALSTVAICVANHDTKQVEEGLETGFVNGDLLVQTLNSWDCHVKVVSENEIWVATTCGNLKYYRENANEAFRLYVGEIKDVDGLFENIRSFEEDYGKNIQAYTYDHIKKNLADNMTIAEEELVDDTLVLTINVD